MRQLTLSWNQARPAVTRVMPPVVRELGGHGRVRHHSNSLQLGGRFRCSAYRQSQHLRLRQSLKISPGKPH